ncbi:MAG TPA: lipid A hydroxylase LpxO, partial [Herbaspirillum sp.]|nr:lipid A hydroxylase LpxO [Herbaspirillum sp.]
MMTAASSPNETGDQTGRINKLFRFVWLAGQYRRQFKNWNRHVYQAVKFGLVAAVVLAIIWL